ncbi:MAG: HlyD family type I secretion periplasmic adaptor subunit [Rhodocyclaceae bacterium]|nr:HlyD family type I secretion periplasmic adaptor subunit [Rhodocyclaceae bacterium]
MRLPKFRVLGAPALWLHYGFGHPASFGVSVIIVTIVAFVVWGIVAPLNGAVVAQGLVKTELNRKAVQHPEGGIIKRLLAKDGDRVQAGQALLELESVTTDANYQLLREMAAFEAVKHSRLDSEQQLASSFALDQRSSLHYGSELVSSAYQRELKIFLVRRRGLDHQLATLNEQLRSVEYEHRSLHRQIKADKEGLRLDEEALAMNRSLESQNFVPRARLLTYERAVADDRSKLAEHEAALGQAEQRVGEIKLRMATTKIEYQRVASEEYKESSNRLVELTERLRPAEDAMRRMLISAPVAGIVVASRYHAPGQVAGPRDILMEIVPDGESLIVEAQTSIDNIKELYLDQTADLRFTAFKSRTTPIVTGRVTYISADALADKNGTPFYQVQVRPDAESLKAAGIQSIQPGMAAEVFVLTEARSPLDYLISPVINTFRKSMRER